AAACVNPYGTALVKEAFAPDPNTQLPSARLWGSLVPVQTWESRAVIASVLAMLVLLRLSPRPFTAAEVLLTAAFALWAWYDKRVAPWWLMLAPWLLAPHLQAVAGVGGAAGWGGGGGGGLRPPAPPRPPPGHDPCAGRGGRGGPRAAVASGALGRRAPPAGRGPGRAHGAVPSRGAATGARGAAVACVQ